MTFDEAKHTLRELIGEHGTLSAFSIENPSNYIFASAGDCEVCLDGKFTADQLEAIAMWMRNPGAFE